MPDQIKACSRKWVAKAFDDQCEKDKGQEHHVEFLDAREDATEALEATKQPLDLVASAVHGAAVLPGRDATLLWRDNRDEAEIRLPVAKCCPPRRLSPSAGDRTR